MYKIRISSGLEVKILFSLVCGLTFILIGSKILIITWLIGNIVYFFKIYRLINHIKGMTNIFKNNLMWEKKVIVNLQQIRSINKIHEEKDEHHVY